MRHPADLARRAARFYTTHLRRLLLEAPEEGPLVQLALQPPTAAAAAADAQAVREFITAWEDADCEVEWTVKRLGAFGPTRLPQRASLRTLGELARWAERGLTPEEARQLPVAPAQSVRLAAALADLLPRYPQADRQALRRHLRALAELHRGGQLEVLRAVADWVRAHSAEATAMSPRAIPVAGADSKFYDTHRRLIQALTGAHDFAPPVVLVEISVLDSGCHIGGFRHLAVPEDTFRAGDFPTRWAGEHPLRAVLWVENRASFLALPPLEGVLAIFGQGFQLPGSDAPWMREVDCVYWGDIDTHGLNIFGRLRTRQPHAEAILMDHATATACLGVAVVEDSPAGTPAESLDADMRALFTQLGAWGQARIEQERIPQHIARTALTRRFAAGAPAD
ncbi:hypothetical protein C1Y63_01220 [Corynebacterium sp. 13CS0277]|uniref:DUF3322 and DUF2220 domain-containing protein n=1 Tax=Corynebacterium sp. 13CS0277 TaxID=2071994 RepID=UPI000D04239F|nr:DUF3322 and DUF2220 domain-containing protein [Corynebacterium sp. 13CS0277]PRQ12441.1 hypothetical protein C1Y63_01220 [Corynebacterium sp. 13CS0277]